MPIIHINMVKPQRKGEDGVEEEEAEGSFARMPVSSYQHWLISILGPLLCFNSGHAIPATLS